MREERFWTRVVPAAVVTRLNGHPYLKKMLSNAGWLLLDNAVRLGGGLLVGIWVASYLGPDRYGQLCYALAFATLFSSMANLGLDSIAVRNMVSNPSAKDEILGTTFALKLLGGVAALCCTMFAISILRPADRLTQLLVGITAIGSIFQAFDTIDLWFQAQVQSKYTVITRNIVFICLTAAKITLVMVKGPLVAFACVGVAETALGSMGLALAYRINGQYLRKWRSQLQTAKELLRDSWPLIFSGIVSVIYLRIDQIMLMEMVGSEELGIYAAAVRLAEAWYFVPMMIYSSIYPSIVEARGVSDELFYHRLQKLYNLMALLAYAIAIPTTFAAPWLVEFLYGPGFSRGGGMLAVLIWAGMFSNLGVARSTFLMSMNWTKVHLMTVFLGCCINVALNLLLIPKYGGMGAVIASFVAYWFAAHGSCFVYQPLHKTGYMLTRAMLYPRVW